MKAGHFKCNFNTCFKWKACIYIVLIVSQHSTGVVSWCDDVQCCTGGIVPNCAQLSPYTAVPCTAGHSRRLQQDNTDTGHTNDRSSRGPAATLTCNADAYSSQEDNTISSQIKDIQDQLHKCIDKCDLNQQQRKQMEDSASGAAAAEAVAFTVGGTLVSSSISILATKFVSGPSAAAEIQGLTVGSVPTVATGAEVAGTAVTITSEAAGAGGAAVTASLEATGATVTGELVGAAAAGAEAASTAAGITGATLGAATVGGATVGGGALVVGGVAISWPVVIAVGLGAGGTALIYYGYKKVSSNRRILLQNIDNSTAVVPSGGVINSNHNSTFTVAPGPGMTPAEPTTSSMPLELQWIAAATVAQHSIMQCLVGKNVNMSCYGNISGVIYSCDEYIHKRNIVTSNLLFNQTTVLAYNKAATTITGCETNVSISYRCPAAKTLPKSGFATNLLHGATQLAAKQVADMCKPIKITENDAVAATLAVVNSYSQPFRMCFVDTPEVRTKLFQVPYTLTRTTSLMAQSASRIKSILCI